MLILSSSKLEFVFESNLVKIATISEYVDFKESRERPLNCSRNVSESREGSSLVLKDNNFSI